MSGAQNLTSDPKWWRICPLCEGRTFWAQRTCETCNGKGLVPR